MLKKYILLGGRGGGGNVYKTLENRLLRLCLNTFVALCCKYIYLINQARELFMDSL